MRRLIGTVPEEVHDGWVITGQRHAFSGSPVVNGGDIGTEMPRDVLLQHIEAKPPSPDVISEGFELGRTFSVCFFYDYGDMAERQRRGVPVATWGMKNVIVAARRIRWCAIAIAYRGHSVTVSICMWRCCGCHRNSSARPAGNRWRIVNGCVRGWRWPGSGS